MAEAIIPLDADRDGSGAEAEVGTSRAMLSLATLVLMTMISYADRSILQLLVDPIQRSLGIDDVQYSILTGIAFASCYAIFTIPSGWLADRYSKRLIIFIGVTGWSIATAAGGLAGSYGELLLSRMAVGLGEAMLTPAAYAVVGMLFARRRLATAIGVLAAGTSLGSAGALAVGGLVVRWAQDHDGLWGLEPWQLTLVLMAMPGLAAAPLVLIIPPEKKRRATASRSEAPPPGFARWLRDNLAYVICISTASGCACALMYAVSAWLPALLSRNYGLSPAVIGSSLGAAIGISGALGFVLSGTVADRLRKSYSIDANLFYVAMVVTISAIIGCLTFALANHPTTIIVLVGVISFVIPINGPVIAHMQASVPPEFRGRLIALFMLVFNLMGMSLGASSVALISNRVLGGSTHLAGGISAACAIFGTLGAILFIASAKLSAKRREQVRSLEAQNVQPYPAGNVATAGKLAG